MNEEEAREMYKELKKYKEIIGNIEPNFNTNLENWTITINLDYYNCLEEYIRRILDELEQKDKEIQFQKEINKTEQDRHKKTEKSLKGQLEKKDKQIEQYQNMLATNDMLHVLECEKKDKIINELEDIFYNYQLCEYELTDCTYRKCEYIADDENPPCKECIKQYFERKVEEDKEYVKNKRI